jgi:peptidoglycan/LPS O-acetylase OafA/YrhL
VTLSNYTQGRDNNFNLIRIMAAFAVLVTHSFALAIGTGAAEPFRGSLGMTMGSIAVDVFFVTSGFLVTGSLVMRQNACEFLWARFLRIFPALLVMLLLTVFGLGPFLTSRLLSSYFTDVLTYGYLVKCATLISGVWYNLPGVFDDNPYRHAVNGSLWSLPYEIRMYAIVVLVWLVFRRIQSIGGRAFSIAVVSATLVAGLFVLTRHIEGLPADQFGTLFFMFFSGASCCLLKEQIAISHGRFCFCAVALLSSALVGPRTFFIAYLLTIAYSVLYLAYIPSGPVRTYNRVGDYSYGVYIYAFPVQQSVAALLPGVSVLLLFLMSACITLALAVLSWHFIERRALAFKGSVSWWVGTSPSLRPIFRE